MRVSTVFGATLAASASIWAIAAPSTQAIQLADGTVSFEKPPNLISATTTYNATYVWGATYYFTLELPNKCR
jgi:hypothetical protein